jgi:hypothetical protein
MIDPAVHRHVPAVWHSAIPIAHSTSGSEEPAVPELGDDPARRDLHGI